MIADEGIWHRYQIGHSSIVYLSKQKSPGVNNGATMQIMSPCQSQHNMNEENSNQRENKKDLHALKENRMALCEYSYKCLHFNSFHRLSLSDVH